MKIQLIKFYFFISIFSVLFFSCAESQQEKKEQTKEDKNEQKDEIINTKQGEIESLTCEQLPNHYTNYDEAIQKIKSADFKIKETVNTSKSSWVREASYYSCDGKFGFFIIKTDTQEYLYDGVPLEIWQGFKNSESFGSYYDRNIKNKFIFKLN